MADGVVDGEAATVQEPEDIEVIEGLVSHIDEDDVVYGSPKWLENFREMKQAALDPLYKDGGDCPKECMVLRLNLHMLMMKAQHGWSDTSFHELLSYLATMYPTGNKVPANMYRATAYRLGSKVTVSAPSGVQIPVTVPEGTRKQLLLGTAVFGTPYAGLRSAWTTPEPLQTAVTLRLP
jgi:hypothetical protein